MRKPFDKALFAENDARARRVVTKQLESYGHYVEPNRNQYGIDLLVYEQASTLEIGLEPWLGVECEIKRVWKGPRLPWKTVQLPERKRKYLSPLHKTQFWILNNECTHAIIIPGAQLEILKPVEVPNKYVAKSELFYQIPMTECLLITLDADIVQDVGG